MCRSMSYAAGPALRLMDVHIKPIHPYVDVGFSISRRHARGSERGSKAVKLHRCVHRGTQKTCAGRLNIDTKTQHLVFPNSLSPRVQWIVDTMIPVSSAISVNHPMVRHQNSNFTLIGSPQSLQSIADHSTKECDLCHTSPIGGGCAGVLRRAVPADISTTARTCGWPIYARSSRMIVHPSGRHRSRLVCGALSAALGIFCRTELRRARRGPGPSLGNCNITPRWGRPRTL